MKSTLKNMVLVLLCITAVASAAVGVVYHVTKEPIAQAKFGKKVEALAQVLPEFDNNPAEEVQVVAIDAGDIYVYPAKKNGEVVGYAVESFTNGFSGVIKMMTGFDNEGNILSIEVLEQSETPGLGAKIADHGNPVQKSFIGKNPVNMNMKVTRDGGEVDAITAATISSRAYIQAVSRAYTAFLEASGVSAPGWDSSTGATSTVEDASSGATSVDTSSGATDVGVSDTDSSDADTASGATDTVSDAVSGDNAKEKTTPDSATGATAGETVMSEHDESDSSSGATSGKKK